MKKAFITVPIAVLLSASIIVTIFLMGIKPDTKHINNAQKISEYSKPAVVKVVAAASVEWVFTVYEYGDYDVKDFMDSFNSKTVIGGSGSGSIISTDGYIVTNAHVVDLFTYDNQKIADEAFNYLCNDVANYFGVSFGEAMEYLLDRVEYGQINKVLKVILPGSEIKDGEIKSFGAPVGEGKDVAVIKIEGSNLPTMQLGDSSNVQLQDSVWVLGYPAAADSNLLSPESSLVMSVTDGKVSATDKKSAQGTPVIQINAAATHGNSGGPVIDEDGTIIGMLTFRGDTVGGQEIQGFNFVIPVNTMKEFINQAGAKNDMGEVDRLYREGLELYWGGYYKDALSKFEALEKIFPKHSEIDRFVSDSQQKIGSSKTLWANYKTVFFIYDGVAGIAVVILIVITFTGGKKKDPILEDLQNIEENKDSNDITPQ